MRSFLINIYLPVYLWRASLGSLPREAFQKLFTELLPEVFDLAAKGKIVIDTVVLSLKDVQSAWEMEIDAGKRLVIVI